MSPTKRKARPVSNNSKRRRTKGTGLSLWKKNVDRHLKSKDELSDSQYPKTPHVANSSSTKGPPSKPVRALTAFPTPGGVNGSQKSSVSGKKLF